MNAFFQEHNFLLDCALEPVNYAAVEIVVCHAFLPSHLILNLFCLDHWQMEIACLALHLCH